MLADAQAGHVADVYDTVPGCTARKVRDDGRLAVPWLWDQEPALDSPRHPSIRRLLREEFRRGLVSARAKFDQAPADRNLLIFETRGTLIDDLLDLGVFADGPGEMHGWMPPTSPGWTERDLVVVDPHVSVRQLGGDDTHPEMRVILTGTTYAADLPYTALGHCWRLWPRPIDFL